MSYMDVGALRLGLFENFTYPISIIKGELSHLIFPMQNFWETLSFFISLLVSSIEEEIQSYDDHVDIVRAWTLEQLQELSKYES